MNEGIKRLTNRHIAKLLDSIQPLDIPEIAINEIKRRMWFLSTDIDEQVLNREQEANGNRLY